jgi:hypothetical protein
MYNELASLSIHLGSLFFHFSSPDKWVPLQNMKFQIKICEHIDKTFHLIYINKKGLNLHCSHCVEHLEYAVGMGREGSNRCRVDAPGGQGGRCQCCQTNATLWKSLGRVRGGEAEQK